MPKEAKAKETKVSKKSTRTKKAAAESSSGPEKKARKTRPKKDPNAPKRGLSAYMFFSQEHRKSVQTDSPDATFGEIGKILGERWKNMSDADKTPYTKKAAADKQRYENEKAAVASGASAAAAEYEEEEEEEDEEEDE